MYAIRNPEGRPFVVGLRDLVTKSAKDTMDTFKQILWDIDQIYYSPNKNVALQDILFHLRNTMSDGAATETKFNGLLVLYRAEILPHVVANWKDLTDELDLHAWIIFSVAYKVLSTSQRLQIKQQAAREVESLFFGGQDKVPIKDPKFKTQSEAGITRMIRKTCNALAYGGDAKTSCHGRFVQVVSDVLKDNDFRSLSLTPFRCNRFNILFHNVSVIYWLHPHIADFLEKDGGVPWVLYDLKVPFFVAGCKALGLISKLITTPLWNLKWKIQI